jgi:hypothetical protein
LNGDFDVLNELDRIGGKGRHGGLPFGLVTEKVLGMFTSHRFAQRVF